MKAKTVRLLAGGLAAVTLMSNMAVMPVFADEAHTTAEITTESMVEETCYAEETNSIEDSSNEDNNASEETETEAEDHNVEQEAEEASVQDTEEHTAAEETKEAEKADENADAEKAETTEAGKAQNEADTVKAEDAAETQSQTEETQTSDGLSENTESDKKTENKDLISVQDAEDTDLLAAGDEEEPVLGSAPVTETQEVNEAKAAEAREKQAREVAAKLTAEVNSCGDILKLLDSLDTIKKISAENPVAANKKNSGEICADTQFDPTCAKILRTAIGAAVKKACDTIPWKIGGFLEGPLKNLLFDYLTINEKEEKKPDTNEKVDQLGGNLLRGMENVGSIGIYGTKLDSFKDCVSDLSSKMELIKSDPIMTENEKNIRIAALIGGSENWYIGGENIFAKMNAASQTMRSKSHEGSMSDAKERNLFDVFYDYNKETSMFSGEAMAKANVSISKRTGQYAKDCRVLLDVLRVHEKVAAMSDAEVAKLSPEVKKVYDKVKTDKGTIRMQMKGIIETFTGNKETTDVKRKIGICDSLKEYGEKDKTVYLEKKGAGFNEIKFSNKPYAQKSENFDKYVLRYYSSFNADQLKKLQEHVNSLGMTMGQYLKMIGMDMSEIEGTDRTVYLSTLEDEKVDKRAIGGAGSWVVSETYDSKAYKGFDINKVGAQETARRYWNTDKKNISDGYNITLRSQKDVDDEQARIAAERAKKEEEIRKWRREQENKIFKPVGDPVLETFLDTINPVKAFKRLFNF